jgi:hypothetical protein
VTSFINPKLKKAQSLLTPSKKLIKHLSKTPILAAQQPQSNGLTLQDSQASLQSNKAAFFFRLERELEKVNELYLQKEAEVRKKEGDFPIPT